MKEMLSQIDIYQKLFIIAVFVFLAAFATWVTIDARKEKRKHKQE